MKKRLIGTLLLGALLVSSTSMFVSCKDYDDDINNIVATKADKTELEAVRQSLQDQIDGHKAQLATIEGRIATLQSDKANKFTENGQTYDLVDVWTALNPLLQKVATLESDLEKEIEARKALDALIGGNISNSQYFSDCKTYYAACEKLYVQLAALNTDLATTMGRVTDLEDALNTPTTGLKAVVADLKGQVDVLNGYKARVETIEADYLKQADKTEVLNKITTLETTLTNKINTLESSLTTAIANAKSEAISTAATDATTKANNAEQNAKDYTDAELAKMGIRVTNLETWQTEASKKIDENFQLINNLTVYVKQALRGLVFNPDSYYQGVEATQLTVLWYVKYVNVNDANAETPEEWGYNSNTDWTIDGYVVTAGDDDATWTSAKTKYDLHQHDLLDKTTRYAFKESDDANSPKYHRVLSFKAEYFMNPSSATVGAADNTVRLVTAVKPFHNSTKVVNGDVNKDGEFNGKDSNKDATITVKNWKAEGGKLIVNLDCGNPEALCQITTDNAITVFATQVRVNDVASSTKDTTITSDFAALYKEDIKDIRISHALTPSLTNVRNTHCGYCSLVDKAGLHLMQTVAEASTKGTTKEKIKAQGGGFDPQDKIGYNDTIDLLDLVEVHYTAYDANGENPVHKMMKDEHFTELGLHYEFELTGLWYGDNNKTSESVHAAIKHVAATETTPEQWLFRPQMPTTDGKALAWDAREEGNSVGGTQDRQTIGRTPIVRVKLLDKDNNILDYGYIRFKVVEDHIGPAPVVYPVIPYNVGQLTASENYCADLDYSGAEFEQSWIQMEYDIHNKLGITQQEFEENYEPDVQGDEFKQFYGLPDGQDEKGVKAANDVYEKLGTIKYRTENAGSQDYETSVITWQITGPQLETYINHVMAAENCNRADVPGKAKLTRYVRFTKVADNFNGNVKIRPQYIYVSFSPAGLTVNGEPTVTAALDWTGRKNPNYWYDKNTVGERTGLVEVHANVYGVEDNEEMAKEPSGQTTTLTSNLAATFIGNEIVDLTDAGDMNSFITVNGTDKVKGKDLKLRLAFVKNGVNSFKGIHTDGKEYTYYVKINADSTKLMAWRDADKDAEQDAGEDDQDIAILQFDGEFKYDINHAKVAYQKTENAKALLNYRAHNDLQDDLITAFVTVAAYYKKCQLDPTGDPINVRFLRPINVESNPDEVQDASVENLQVIYLKDLVKLTDWRDQPFKTNYWHYYGITDIQIVGVAANGKLSDGDGVLTNLSATGAQEAATKKLKEVSTLLDFKYEPISIPLANLQPDAAPAAGAYGRLVYTNLGSTVQDFKLILPVKVKYIWGEVYTTVEVQVHHTTSNARLAK